jgi:hypothetical protein
MDHGGRAQTKRENELAGRGLAEGAEATAYQPGRIS